ncbi:MAG: redoxin domain-containing protein [Syntrophaceae bacterium]|nr:redoxin domain-containing protein [Syntrophaceae bacterium]
MQAAQTELNAMGVNTIGVSPDNPAVQKKFSTANRLSYPLLSDADHVVAMAYGAWGEKSMYGKKYEGIIRSAILIAEEGHVLGAWYKIRPDDTVSPALRCLESN